MAQPKRVELATWRGFEGIANRKLLADIVLWHELVMAKPAAELVANNLAHAEIIKQIDAVVTYSVPTKTTR